MTYDDARILIKALANTVVRLVSYHTPITRERFDDLCLWVLNVLISLDVFAEEVRDAEKKKTGKAIKTMLLLPQKDL